MDVKRHTGIFPDDRLQASFARIFLFYRVQFPMVDLELNDTVFGKYLPKHPKVILDVGQS